MRFYFLLATTVGNPLRAALAKKIRQYLLAIGISVNIAYYPLDSFFALYTKGGILATGALEKLICCFTLFDFVTCWG